MAEATGPAPRFRSSEAAEQVATRELVAAMRETLRSSDDARLAIPGGSALEAVVGLRAELARDWARVKLTWVDERCVDRADAESNRGRAQRLGLLTAVEGGSDRPAPRGVLPLYEDGETPAAAVARVEAGLASDFEGALDVVLLGMGEDGHVASLFPSRPMPTEGWVAHVNDSPKPPTNRITLTRACLATARFVVLLAMGEGKREALERLEAGDPRLPAYGLGGLVVVTDLELGHTLRSKQGERK